MPIAIAVTIAGGALGVSGSLTLTLKGEYATRTASACGKREQFSLYHRSSSILYTGFLTPRDAE
jgi:hypothetical protein